MKAGVAVVVGFHVLADLIIIFVNKAVLNFSPHIPLLFLFLQLAVTVGLLHLAATFLPKIGLPTRAEISWSTFKNLAPVMFTNMAGLVFGILCLRDVDASFFQIARGLIIPLTIIVSSHTTRLSPSIPILICAVVVTLGFLIGVLPSSLLSLSFDTVRWPAYSSIPRVTTSSMLISLLYGIISSFFIALHTSLVKTSLPYVDYSTVKLAWWSNLGGTLMLLPFVLLSGDVAFALGLMRYGIDIRGNVGGFGVWKWWLFLLGSIVTGLFGSLLCLAGPSGTKATNCIPNMFSNVAKGVCQALLGVWLFGDILTVPRASSILVILTGNILYMSIKGPEPEENPNNRCEITEESKEPEESEVVP